jgi:ParB family chromosome partitioning protein
VAKAKGGLSGKGLDVLIGQAASEYNVTKDSEISGKTEKKSKAEKNNADGKSDFLVDIELLKPNPQQPRTEFDEEALNELAASIKENGIIQPPLVEDAGNGTYYIIAGERRCRAAKLAGLKQIPVRVQKFTEEKKLEVALIENIQREDLNPIEEAIAYKKMMELSNINQEEVAKRVGKNRSTVANALRLLKLPENMQTELANGKISAGHARAILSVVNPSDQAVLFARILGQGLSVRDAENQALQMNEGNRVLTKKTEKKTAVKDNRDAQIVALENQFIEALGTKVILKGDLKKGMIQIEYFSRDDLDRLYNIFTVKQ